MFFDDVIVFGCLGKYMFLRLCLLKLVRIWMEIYFEFWVVLKGYICCIEEYLVI